MHFRVDVTNPLNEAMEIIFISECDQFKLSCADEFYQKYLNHRTKDMLCLNKIEPLQICEFNRSQINL